MSKDLLTNLTISNIATSERVQRLNDGGGLYIEIRPPSKRIPSGLRVFRYRYAIAGRENIFTIGELGDKPHQVTLAEARLARSAAQALVAQGMHPRAHKRTAVAKVVAHNLNTFQATAVEWLNAKKPNISKHYHDQLSTAVNRDLVPAIGDMPLTEVKSGHIMPLLVSLAGTPSWAKLVLRTCGEIYDHAIMADRCDNDPTRRLENFIGEKGSGATILKPKKKANAWLYMREVPELLAAVDAIDDADRIRKIGLKLLMLTMVRPGELAGAPWSEFDFEGVRSVDEEFHGPAWYIPAERMKMGMPHHVPLSTQALALLTELKTLTGHSPFLFPEMKARKRKGAVPKTTQYFTRFITRELGFGGRLTAHGLRGTASTYLNSVRIEVAGKKVKRFEKDVIECALSHTPKGIAAHYDHNSYMPQRAELLQHYADTVLPPPAAVSSGANVLPMRRAA